MANNIKVKGVICDDPQFTTPFIVSNGSPEFEVTECCTECKTPLPLIRVREGIKVLPVKLDMTNGTTVQEETSGLLTTVKNGVAVFEFPTALVAGTVVKFNIDVDGCESNSCEYIVEEYDPNECECDDTCYINLKSLSLEKSGTDSYKISNLQVLTNTKLKYKIGDTWVSKVSDLPSFTDSVKLEISSTSSGNCKTEVSVSILTKLSDIDVVDPIPCKLYNIQNTGAVDLSYTYKNCQGLTINATLSSGNKICVLASELPTLNNAVSNNQVIVSDLRGTFSTTTANPAPFAYGQLNGTSFIPFTSYIVRDNRLSWGDGSFLFPQIGIVEDQGSLAPNRILMHPFGASSIPNFGQFPQSDACVRYTAPISGYLTITGDSLRNLTVQNPSTGLPNLESIITIKKGSTVLYTYSHQTQGANDAFNLTNISVNTGDTIDIIVDSGDSTDNGEFSFDHVHVSALFTLSQSQASGTVTQDDDCESETVCKSYQLTNTSSTSFVQYTYKSCIDDSTYNNILQPSETQCVWSKEVPVMLVGNATITPNACEVPSPLVLPQRMLGLGTFGNVYPGGTNWSQDLIDSKNNGANAWYSDIWLSSGALSGFDLAFKNRAELRLGNVGDSPALAPLGILDKMFEAIQTAKNLGLVVVFRFNCAVKSGGGFIADSDIQKDSTGALLKGFNYPTYSGSFASQDYRDLCIEFATYVLRKSKAIGAKVAGCSFAFSAQSESGFNPFLTDGRYTTFDYSSVNTSRFLAETGTSAPVITEMSGTNAFLWESAFSNTQAKLWANYNRNVLHEMHVEFNTRIRDHFPDLFTFCDFGQGFGVLSMMTHGGGGHEMFSSTPFGVFKTNDYERVPNGTYGVTTWEQNYMSVSAAKANSSVPIWTEVLCGTVVSDDEVSGQASHSNRMGLEWGKSAFKNGATAFFMFGTASTLGGSLPSGSNNFWDSTLVDNPNSLMALMSQLSSIIFAPSYNPTPDPNTTPDYNFTYLNDWDCKVQTRWFNLQSIGTAFTENRVINLT